MLNVKSQKMTQCEAGIQRREKCFPAHLLVSKTPFGIEVYPHLSLHTVGTFLHTEILFSWDLTSIL